RGGRRLLRLGRVRRDPALGAGAGRALPRGAARGLPALRAADDGGPGGDVRVHTRAAQPGGRRDLPRRPRHRRLARELLRAGGHAPARARRRGRPGRDRPLQHGRRGRPAARGAARALRLLVLGGSGFLGRHLVEATLARGHEPTLFNRGRTNTALFAEVEKLRGDRDGDLAALRGREWDAVVDVHGRIPRHVATAAEALATIEHYTFVSSISAYADFSRAGIDETAPLREYDPSMGDVDMEFYGARKAECERIVAEAFPAGSLILRPGLIVGPHDPTDRFTYWPRRIEAGGHVLAPGDPSDPVQFVDVRDLGDWIVHATEEELSGTYNATGEVTTFQTLLDECIR